MIFALVAGYCIKIRKRDFFCIKFLSPEEKAELAKKKAAEEQAKKARLEKKLIEIKMKKFKAE